MAARTLACVADVLGAMAGERAGLRSGPARNESWMHAFELLDVSVLRCFNTLHILAKMLTYASANLNRKFQYKSGLAWPFSPSAVN